MVGPDLKLWQSSEVKIGFLIAHCTALHSSSQTAYLWCVGVRLLEAHWMTLILPFFICIKAKPKPCNLDAPVSSIVSRFGSKGRITISKVKMSSFFSNAA